MNVAERIFPDGGVALPQPAGGLYVPISNDLYSFNSPWLDVRSGPWVGISVWFVGTQPVGNIQLMGSNDLDGGQVGGLAPATFLDATKIGAVVAVSSGIGLAYTWDIITAYRWIQVQYTKTSSIACQVYGAYCVKMG